MGLFQARLPFTEEELQHIKKLDINADKNLLRRELPVLREESLRTMEVATTLLKLCAADGLSLNEIGEIMSRPLTALDDGESDLEIICMKTKQQLFAPVSEDGLGSCSDDGSGFESPRLGDDLQFHFDDMKGEERVQLMALCPTVHIIFIANRSYGYAHLNINLHMGFHCRFEPFTEQEPL